jgi:hypothetical protein
MGSPLFDGDGSAGVSLAVVMVVGVNFTSYG